jgi:orotate phosphoribosyltransferase
VHEIVMNLVAARAGHFRFESGHHGELWLDLDGVFWSAAALAPVVGDLAERIGRYRLDVVCGPLAGGAFLAQSVAARLGAGFAYTERVSAGSGALYSAHYELPAALGPRVAGRRVAVVDDVINAGSATMATVTALGAAGAEVVVLAAMLALGPTPARVAAELALPLEVVTTQDNAIWPPADCPRCARGEPLSGPELEPGS